MLRKRSQKSLKKLQAYLDEINAQVEQPDYIPKDPVQFVHAFSDKKEIEIAGFFAAIMAWGRRDIVIAKVDGLLKRMDYKPWHFIMEYNHSSIGALEGFKHRTFKPADIHIFCLILQNIYRHHPDFEHFWKQCYNVGLQSGRPMLAVFHERFFQMAPEIFIRTRKHISNPEKGSTCKRLYMYLRWMIRKNSPVDIGIWNFMPACELLIPFDVHVARQSRRYGLLGRKSNDWLAVQELTHTCKLMNPEDPAIYDYSLFGLGALEYRLPKRFILNKVK